jgi:TetR/AcrR family acrAB operon transcriptional repressor
LLKLFVTPVWQRRGDKLMVRRTKEEAQETRNRILDTAEQVFVKKGVSNTSLAQLAEAAGVTRGAIYWHFRNKADLFDAMMSRVVLPMEEMAARAGDTWKIPLPMCGPVR